MKNDSEREPFFTLSIQFIKEYEYLHYFFTAVYSFLLLFLISRFTNNILIVTLLYIPLLYLFYITQIRYFMGIYAVYLALYYFFVKSNKVLALIFLLFGISNHFGLLLFLLFVPFFYVSEEKIIKYSLYGMGILSGCLLLLIVLGTTIFSGIRFVAYFSRDLVSSFTGGIYAFFPYFIVWIFTVNVYQNNLKYNPFLLSDKKYKYLVIMSIVPIIFLGVAFFLHVIGHRVIITATLFQILFFLYSLKYYKNKFNKIIGFISIYTFLVTYIFVLPRFLGIDDSLQEAYKVFISNSLFYLQ